VSARVEMAAVRPRRPRRNRSSLPARTVPSLPNRLRSSGSAAVVDDAETDLALTTGQPVDSTLNLYTFESNACIIIIFSPFSSILSS